MFYVNNKEQKKKTMVRIELSKQESIRMLEEKKNPKYSEIFKVDTI